VVWASLLEVLMPEELAEVVRLDDHRPIHQPAPAPCMADLVGDDLYDLALSSMPAWAVEARAAGRLEGELGEQARVYLLACVDLMERRQQLLDALREVSR
jgi:hypothetical protein